MRKRITMALIALAAIYAVLVIEKKTAIFSRIFSKIPLLDKGLA